MSAIGCSAVVQGIGHATKLQMITFWRRGSKRPVRQTMLILGKYYILEDNSSLQFEKRAMQYYKDALEKGIKDKRQLLHWAYEKAVLIDSLHANVEERSKEALKCVNNSPCRIGEGSGLIKKLPALFY